MIIGAMNLVSDEPCVARAEDAHRRALALLAEPGRRIGDADRERATGDADEEPDQYSQYSSHTKHPGPGPPRQASEEVHDAPAVAIREDAQRQAYQRSAGSVWPTSRPNSVSLEIELRLDLHADDGEHHRRPRVHREGDRARGQSRDLLAAEAPFWLRWLSFTMAPLFLG